MFKKDKNDIDEFVNENFERYMGLYVKLHQEEMEEFKKGYPEGYIDSEAIIPYLLYRTFKSQELLNEVTKLLTALTAILVFLTIILAYLTMQL